MWEQEKPPRTQEQKKTSWGVFKLFQRMCFQCRAKLLNELIFPHYCFHALCGIVSKKVLCLYKTRAFFFLVTLSASRQQAQLDRLIIGSQRCSYPIKETTVIGVLMTAHSHKKHKTCTRPEGDKNPSCLVLMRNLLCEKVNPALLSLGKHQGNAQKSTLILSALQIRILGKRILKAKQNGGNERQCELSSAVLVKLAHQAMLSQIQTE